MKADYSIKGEKRPKSRIFFFKMIKISEDTVFNVNADCLVNTVIAKGVMGKGLALDFALRFPTLEDDYIFECKRKEVKPGQIFFNEVEGFKIINFVTRKDYKSPVKMSFIEEGLNEFKLKYKEWGIKSVAFPMFGARSGGLNKKKVKDLISDILGNIDIDIFICEGTRIDGREMEMLRLFRNTPVGLLRDKARLSSKQLESLQNGQHTIKRFSDIYDLPNIGQITYRALFEYFYSEGKRKEQTSEQMSLF